MKQIRVSADIAGENDVGGIAGIAGEHNSQNDTFLGERLVVDATISGTNRVGGLFGSANHLKMTLQKSAFRGHISATNNISGLVGYARHEERVKGKSTHLKCTNSFAAITMGHRDRYGAGIIGGFSFSFRSEDAIYAGLLGAEDTGQTCFYDQTSDPHALHPKAKSITGTGLPAADLRQRETYAPFNPGVWDIPSTGLPKLQWEKEATKATSVGTGS